MAFTYSPEDISPSAGTTISAVRFLLQDTISAEALLSDEEITATYADTSTDYSQEQRVYLSAAMLAQTLAVRFSREVDFSSGGTSVTHSRRVQQWEATASRLAAQAREAITGSGLSILFTGRPATF